jgi:uncharacterized phiE125 gp8 family phage protein
MAVKVITPPTLTSVVATVDLRTHLRLASDGSEDGLATAYLAAAHAVAEHYTGRPIGAQTLELPLDCFPGYYPDNEIALSPAVTSISSIKYMDTAGVEQTIASTDYALNDYDLICTVVPDEDYDWPDTQEVQNAIKVRFVAGDTPAAVKSALLLMVAWLNENRGSEMASDDIQPAAAKALLNTVKVWGA